MFNNFFFENRTVYEIMSKSMVEPEGPQMTSQYDICIALSCTRLRARAHARMLPLTHPRIRNIYCFYTATVIRECASLLRYTYIICLVTFRPSITLRFKFQLLPRTEVFSL
jgi:hypothetical protein